MECGRLACVLIVGVLIKHILLYCSGLGSEWYCLMNKTFSKLRETSAAPSPGQPFPPSSHDPEGCIDPRSVIPNPPLPLTKPQVHGKSPHEHASEQVLARPPSGFRDFDERGVAILWLMNNPLYGQLDAGAIWNRTFNEGGLESAGCPRCGVWLGVLRAPRVRRVPHIRARERRSGARRAGRLEPPHPAAPAGGPRKLPVPPSPSAHTV